MNETLSNEELYCSRVQSALLFSAIFLCSVLPIQSQVVSPGGNGIKDKRDLSGIWFQKGLGPSTSYRRFSIEDPPLQPWAMDIYKTNRAGVKEPNGQGLQELDPLWYCFPPGATRSMLLNYPFEIIQVPNQLYILFEYDHGIRRVYMDGREHPEAYPFGWMGHSIGKWDGDTLVVDTVGLNDRTWLDRVGTPHSDALHVVERFRRVNHNTLEIEFLFDDPKAFTKPWEGKVVYLPRPTSETNATPDSKAEIAEYVPCEEHLQIGKYREVRDRK